MSLSTAPSPAIASYSYHNPTYTPLTPDNFIVSPAINLSSSTSPILRYKVKTQDEEFPTEHYAVYVATTNSVAAFLANPPVFEETVTDNGPGGVYYKKEVDLSAYHGQPQVYVAFRHFQSHDQFSIHIDDVMVGEKPAVVPNCATMVTPVNGTVNSPYKSVPLEWNAPTTGALIDSYDIYLDTNPNPTTLIGNTEGLTFTATDLNYSTTYYWKAVPKNVIGSAASCQVFSFSTRIKDYCDAGATTLVYEKISNVTFAGINNSSTSTAGYEDFTAVVGNVNAGQNNIPFSASHNDPTSTSDQIMVWIDLNGDRDFDDTGELVLTTPKKNSPWTGSISIPANTPAQTTRMRIRLHDASSTPMNSPCGDSKYGQVEDYTLVIGPALGTSENLKAQKIVGYPNPVKDLYTIKSQSKIQAVKVFDAAGKLVITESQNKISFEGLQNGVYMVQTTLEDGSTLTSKVIKE